ncbi:hypothetical protein ERX46_02755 [Brumimicrobium glaciale]|uniref:DUF3899 domain-containing protein n=1 Tax=Brumimicrobium glaciale TaxID=200475 RepID=A0A4V1WG96_9FLAO|nr:hypothetical protein [Brumimicrobium glaciale]RYM35931.1 hypothetical protein ERX46_02755 [Brumimicrobium glaciale]
MKGILEKKSKFFTIYFIVVTVLYILGISFVSGQVKNYIPIFYMFAGFVFFAINFSIELNHFSVLLKKVDPLLYNAYSISFGPFKGRRLNNLIIFNVSKEIKNIGNTELIQRHKLLLKLVKVIVLSFISMPIILVLFFY